jgi:K+-sensing histidine kinase KdpD
MNLSPAQARAAGPPHVLVCIRGDADDLELMRRGRALAGWLQGRLTVLHPFCLGRGEDQRQALAQDRAYARSPQAPLVELPAYSPEDGIVEYSRTRSVTHLVLPAGEGPAWYAAWRDSLPERLARRLSGVDLYVAGGCRCLTSS